MTSYLGSLSNLVLLLNLVECSYDVVGIENGRSLDRVAHEVEHALRIRIWYI